MTDMGHKSGVFFLLVTICSFGGRSPAFSTVSKVLEQRYEQSLSKKMPQSSSDFSLRELPPDEYSRLRAEVMAGARMNLGPRIRNTKISEQGFDFSVLAVLKEERTYLSRPKTLSPANVAVREQGPSSSARQHSPVLLHSPGTLLSNKSGSVGTSSCRQPGILAVNGRTAGAVFTAQPSDNHYRIEGCSFGLPGNVQLEPDSRVLNLGARIPPIALQLDTIQSWSDTEIDVHLDPHLSGVGDSAVALVIYPSNGRRLDLPGCLFVAARSEPILLNTIPASWIKLSATTASSHAIRQIEYVSPPSKGTGVPADAVGASALIVRSDPDPFTAGTDAYDFTHLGAGWVVDSVQIQRYSAICPGDVISDLSFGTWGTTWTEHGFTISWDRNVCASYVRPVFRFGLTSSEYAAKVWVVGPVGTQPTSF